MKTHFIFPLVAFVVAGLFSAGATAALRRWALRRRFVDHPGGHKAHAAPVALGGGVAVAAAVLLPMLAAVAFAWHFADAGPNWIPEFVARHLGGIRHKAPVALGIVVATITLCFAGLVDDARPMSAQFKLLVQVVVAAFLVLALDLRLMTHLPWILSVGLSILWILTLTNAMNFLDNTDGLAAGVALIAASVFAFAAMRAGQVFVPTCCWLLAGALAGFLPFNLHPARIYLGDAGSLVIGLLLAVFTILTTFAAPEQGQTPFGILAPLVVMAVPLYDTASVIVLRRRSGAPIWVGDRSHFSHRLIRRGMGVRQAVLVIWLTTLVTALPALLLPNASWPLAWGILLQTFLVVSLVALLESSNRL